MEPTNNSHLSIYSSSLEDNNQLFNNSLIPTGNKMSLGFLTKSTDYFTSKEPLSKRTANFLLERSSKFYKTNPHDTIHIEGTEEDLPECTEFEKKAEQCAYKLTEIEGKLCSGSDIKEFKEILQNFAAFSIDYAEIASAAIESIVAQVSHSIDRRMEKCIKGKLAKKKILEIQYELSGIEELNSKNVDLKGFGLNKLPPLQQIYAVKNHLKTRIKVISEDDGKYQYLCTYLGAVLNITNHLIPLAIDIDPISIAIGQKTKRNIQDGMQTANCSNEVLYNINELISYNFYYNYILSKHQERAYAPALPFDILEKHTRNALDIGLNKLKAFIIAEKLSTEQYDFVEAYINLSSIRKRTNQKLKNVFFDFD